MESGTTSKICLSTSRTWRARPEAEGSCHTLSERQGKAADVTTVSRSAVNGLRPHRNPRRNRSTVYTVERLNGLHVQMA
jgi:hypothetical protein